jgi:hypothetical protein
MGSDLVSDRKAELAIIKCPSCGKIIGTDVTFLPIIYKHCFRCLEDMRIYRMKRMVETARSLEKLFCGFGVEVRDLLRSMDWERKES